MTKAEIRELISERKKTFFQTLEKNSKPPCNGFQTLELFREAKTVGAYMPLPDEVDITPLFNCGSAGGVALPETSKPKGRANSPSEPKKTFYIPAFDEGCDGYRLAEISKHWKKGKFGIPEPVNPVFAPEKLDLIIVPGIAFDRAGRRIGRGGGFYDRLLPKYDAVRVGVCFDFQCLENVPSEPHDCGVDWLVTESKFSNLRRTVRQAAFSGLSSRHKKIKL